MDRLPTICSARREATSAVRSRLSWPGSAGGPALPQFRASKGAPLTIKRRPVSGAERRDPGPRGADRPARPGVVSQRRVAPTHPAPAWSRCRARGRPRRVRSRARDARGRRSSSEPASSVPIAAVLVGGYGGTWLRPGLLDTPYAPGPLAAVGSAVGAGVLAAIAASSCGIAETARVATYMANESAGQCGPCLYGLHDIAQDLVQLARGENDSKTVTRLTRSPRRGGRSGGLWPPRRRRSIGEKRSGGLRPGRRRSRTPSSVSGMEPSARPARGTFGGSCRRAAVSGAQPMAIVASRYRLRVNPVACDAFGYCAELVPEIVVARRMGIPDSR